MKKLIGLVAVMLMSCALASVCKVTFTINRGPLTNMVPDETFSTLCMDTNEFFTLGIQSSEAFSADDIRASARDGVDVWIATHPTQAMFSVLDHANTNYVRNGKGFPCVSVWNSCGDPQLSAQSGLDPGVYRNGALIEPDLVIFVEHYHPEVGDTIRFVGDYNTVYERTIIHYESAAGTGIDDDISIAWLDSDLPITPASISPKQILIFGDTWETPFYVNPAIGVGIEGEWCVHEIYRRIGGTLNLYYPTPTYPFGDGHGGGHSGTPMFQIINGRQYLVGLLVSVNETLVYPQDYIIEDLKSRYTPPPPPSLPQQPPASTNTPPLP